MQLYHYRSIESALAEIGDGTFHFASRDELNDPIEGFLRVYWQGDKSAWEGLFRNYVCSLYQAIEFYQLRADEEALHHQSLVIDIHARDHTPLGEIWKRIGDQFTADPTIQRLAEFYGRNRLKISEKELRLILHFVHGIAVITCIKSRKSIVKRSRKLPRIRSKICVNFILSTLDLMRTYPSLNRKTAMNGQLPDSSAAG